MARTPSKEEKKLLRALFEDTLLMSAHGQIVENVRNSLADLFRTLKRPDLAERVVDWEKLLGD